MLKNKKYPDDILHELRQPLTAVKGFAQAMLADLAPKDPLRRDVLKIIEQSRRMEKIIARSPRQK